ncbi:MAG: cell division topological specificity factor MinE [Halothiobacillaceae bacterium]|jgi:cell division topological specificity factor|nr:cell division topological specificity factor MinE [Halothiobacillaceae bacterium]
MGFIDFFRSSKKGSASLAKERLQIIIAHERTQTRGEPSGPDYLPMLEKDLLEVIRRYVPVGEEAVKVRVEREEGMEVLELNITLPEPPTSGR